MKKKKVKFKLSASPWWRDSTISSFKYDIVEYNKMGINNFEICIHIDNENNKMVVKEDIEGLLDLSKRTNINAIKIHCLYEVFNSVPDSRNEYKNIVLNLANKFKGLNIKYFIVLNELKEIHHNKTEENYNFVNELFTEIRKLGYIPGTSFAGPDSFNIAKTNFGELIDINDCLFINFYPSIGNKGINTTKEDSIKYWSYHVDTFEKIKQEYPDKPIIMSECGIKHYWEYLKDPWDYGKDDIYTDGKGEVAKIFFYGLFESERYNNVLDEVWIWYPEEMRYKEFYDFMEQYI